MTAVTITPSGPFSLEASLRFLEGFTPASYDDVGGRVLRLAFPADDGHSTVAAAVRQDEPAGDGAGTVRIEFAVHALAEAVADGRLDAARLRATPVEDALATLRTLPGIGPFSAELVLIRGAGHPDVFPHHERRLHASIADEYGLGTSEAGDVRRLAEIADHWKPYRSWVALLLRARADEKARVGPH
ncbi:hypothetical protein GCM10010182_58040 [Actinomadura cremea]|nr:hypothetical protein GCM10010182_58040 [Actinomadura cremea]